MENIIELQSSDDYDFVQQMLTSNIEDRRIVINCDIDDNLLERVVLFILKWNKEDKFIPTEKRKPIYLYISSDGGDALIGNQILSAIKCSKTPIVTVGMTTCASMASYILAAGTKRYAFANTVILYHDGQTGYVSSGNKGKDIQRFYDCLDERMKQFMVSSTKMSNEFIESIKDREYYMFADEAKELGIIDYIIGVDCDLDEIL